MEIPENTQIAFGRRNHTSEKEISDEIPEPSENTH